MKNKVADKLNKGIKLENKLHDKLDNTCLVASKPSFTSVPVPGHKTDNSFEIICSICGKEIVDYKPKYFLWADFNPASTDFEDSFKGDNSDPDPYKCKQFQQQCMLEQPLPPPTPSNPLETDINILDGDEPLFISTMVSHCNLNFIKLFQRLVYEQKFGNLILSYELKL